MDPWSTDRGHRIGVVVDAGRLWAGGAASAIVSALMALVGVPDSMLVSAVATRSIR